MISAVARKRATLDFIVVGWDDVLPYFTRLESDADFGHEPWHGDGGPMPSARYLTLGRS